MSTSYIELEDLGRIRVFRRRGLKNIRISINSIGEIRLSIPWYVPKAAGLKYLQSKKDWIKKHQKVNNTQWSDGQAITKDCVLKVHTHNQKRTKSYVEKGFLHIYLSAQYGNESRQIYIQSHINKFLKEEGERLLIPLAAKMAEDFGFKVKNIRIKNLKSRWGSCNHDKVITLNLSLIKLPPELAEYVIFHELAHTKHLNHSQRFWQEVEALMPDYKHRRKALKAFNINGIF